jgi:hypothetical protein
MKMMTLATFPSRDPFYGRRNYFFFKAASFKSPDFSWDSISVNDSPTYHPKDDAIV